MLKYALGSFNLSTSGESGFLVDGLWDRRGEKGRAFRLVGRSITGVCVFFSTMYACLKYGCNIGTEDLVDVLQ